MCVVKLRGRLPVGREIACREGKTGMKVDMGNEKVIFYKFEAILQEAEGEVQVRTSDKKGDSLGTEEHLQEQSCQRW